MKLLTLFVLILSSCGSNDKNYMLGFFQGIDPEFNEFVSNFEYEFNTSIKTIPINFDPTNFYVLDNVGVCIKSSSKRVIFINRFRWESLNYNQREIIIFHELAHCKLDIDEHFDDFLEDGCPASILNSKMFNANQSILCYNENRDYYLDELESHM